MSTRKATPEDPRKRRTTRYRGVSFRERVDGSRLYSVYFQGRYISVAGNENEALAKQAELRGKAARGETPVTPTKTTFAEVAEKWLESKRVRPYTYSNYRASLDNVLLPRFGQRKIASITTDDVAALVRALERKGLAPATITDYLKPLKGTMNFAARRGLIAVNPCSLLTRDERPRSGEQRQDHVWSDEEIDALIQTAEQLARRPASRYDYSPLIRTALFTGLRLGELLGLQWRDLDLAEGVLHVRRQWTRGGAYGPTKSKAAVRRIALSEEMTKYLAELKLGSRFSGDEQPVFASKIGRPLGHRNATGRGFEPAAKEAEIEGVSFHSMRHAFASRMIDRGISSTVLAALMGHESSAITERRYIHLFDRQRTDDLVRKAMAQ